MSGLNDKMKCFGCKNDKPVDQFDQNPALCRSCVFNTAFSSHRRSTSGKSGKSSSIADAFGDFFEGIFSIFD
jgi:hypothetical protein